LKRIEIRLSARKSLAICLFGTASLLAGGVFGAQPVVSTPSPFAVLSAAPDSLGKVICTDATITGDVGSSGAAASVVQTKCTINGSIFALPATDQRLTAFYDAYAATATASCDKTLTGTLAGVTLKPGVYCFDAAATLTGQLILAGLSTETWLFKVGTGGTGALTGTDFSVLLANGAQACNVTWWVAEAATMTTSNFKGTILAGAGITVTSGTSGTFTGNALAKATVTLTGGSVTGCADTSAPPTPKTHCNQGVGNGPEACDPGNSNQANPFRSNDELGGVPGKPGRKGGNK
jgi:hypothetical protein